MQVKASTQKKKKVCSGVGPYKNCNLKSCT